MYFKPLVIKTSHEKTKGLPELLLREATKQGRHECESKNFWRQVDRRQFFLLWCAGGSFKQPQSTAKWTLLATLSSLLWVLLCLPWGQKAMDVCSVPLATWQKSIWSNNLFLITHIYEVLQLLKRQNPSNRCMEQIHCLSNLFFFRRKKSLRVHS